jgi:hypothetical protein
MGGRERPAAERSSRVEISCTDCATAALSRAFPTAAQCAADADGSASDPHGCAVTGRRVRGSTLTTRPEQSAICSRADST